MDKNDKVKSSLYDTLDRLYQIIPKHDAVIHMGDMKAKVGEEI
jgi:hypothetical protein